MADERERPRTSRWRRRPSRAGGEDRAADERASAAAGQPAARAQPAEEPKDSEPRNPSGNIANGRPDDKATPPGLSSGDPLAARESRK